MQARQIECLTHSTSWLSKQEVALLESTEEAICGHGLPTYHCQLMTVNIFNTFQYIAGRILIDAQII